MKFLKKHEKEKKKKGKKLLLPNLILIIEQNQVEKRKERKQHLLAAGKGIFASGEWIDKINTKLNINIIEGETTNVKRKMMTKPLLLTSAL